MKTLTASLLGLISVASASDSNAADEVDKSTAPAVEISAFRIPTLLKDTTQSVDLIDGIQLDARRPATVIDVLQQVPGLHVDQLGSAGGIGNVYIRGSDPEHVLVLIDGARANDSTLSRGGAYDLTSLDPSEVERIEIVKGPASALYGADAMGGLINVITRVPKKDGFSADLGGGVGGGGFRQAGITGGVSSEFFKLSLGASMLKDGERDDGGELDVRTYRGSVLLTPVTGLGVRIFGRHNEREGSNFPDASGGNRLSVFRTLEERESEESTLGFDANYAVTDFLSLRASASSFKRDEVLNSPGVSPRTTIGAVATTTQYERDVGLVSVAFKLPARTDLVIGYEQQKEEGNRSGTLDVAFVGVLPSDFALERKTRSWFAEAKVKPIDALVLQAGVRKDSISGFDSDTNPSAGIRYDIEASGTTLKAHYAEGFRPPSFSALGDPNFGSSTLKPERSKSTEIGVEQSLIADRLRLGVTAFKADTENLIDFDFNTFRLVNRSHVETEGVEFEVAAKPMDSLMVALTHTYVDTDVIGGDPLLHRPNNRSGLRIVYTPMEALTVSWTTAYVASTFDNSVPTGDVKVGSYSRSDAAASYRWGRYTMALNVDNVFDKRYEQYVGFVNPGIRVRLGVSASF